MGQKFKTYSIALKKEAIRLHVEEKWTYRRITEPWRFRMQIV
ncbi:hypothetical protein [Paenibacillus ottowii]|nr:hypothetical protein [Paenibacillus ottowii]